MRKLNEQVCSAAGRWERCEDISWRCFPLSSSFTFGCPEPVSTDHRHFWRAETTGLLAACILSQDLRANCIKYGDVAREGCEDKRYDTSVSFPFVSRFSIVKSVRNAVCLDLLVIHSFVGVCVCVTLFVAWIGLKQGGHSGLDCVSAARRGLLASSYRTARRLTYSEKTIVLIKF